MEKAKNDNKKTPLDNILSNNLKTAKDAVKIIRKEGKIQDLPEIIRAMRMHDREEIRSELKSLLCDIQTSGIQPYIIEEIKNPDNKDILHILLGVCWENKQDFSPFLEVFVSAFLNTEYKASIEAFTMIEQIFMDYDFDKGKLISTIKTIKMAYPDITEDKRELALVLIDSLENLMDK